MLLFKENSQHYQRTKLNVLWYVLDSEDLVEDQSGQSCPVPDELDMTAHEEPESIKDELHQPVEQLVQRLAESRRRELQLEEHNKELEQRLQEITITITIKSRQQLTIQHYLHLRKHYSYFCTHYVFMILVKCNYRKQLGAVLFKLSRNTFSHRRLNTRILLSNIQNYSHVTHELHRPTVFS